MPLLVCVTKIPHAKTYIFFPGTDVVINVKDAYKESQFSAVFSVQ
jgi:hypothetical protein